MMAGADRQERSRYGGQGKREQPSVALRSTLHPGGGGASLIATLRTRIHTRMRAHTHACRHTSTGPKVKARTPPSAKTHATTHKEAPLTHAGVWPIPGR
jgi:hypothetical protein